jgi:hypothetical protein
MLHARRFYGKKRSRQTKKSEQQKSNFHQSVDGEICISSSAFRR